MCPSDTFAKKISLAKVEIYVESTHFPKIFARGKKKIIKNSPPKKRKKVLMCK
jgi:hypothetical protein